MEEHVVLFKPMFKPPTPTETKAWLAASWENRMPAEVRDRLHGRKHASEAPKPIPKACNPLIEYSRRLAASKGQTTGDRVGARATGGISACKPPPTTDATSFRAIMGPDVARRPSQQAVHIQASSAVPHGTAKAPDPFLQSVFGDWLLDPAADTPSASAIQPDSCSTQQVPYPPSVAPAASAKQSASCSTQQGPYPPKVLPATAGAAAAGTAATVVAWQGLPRNQTASAWVNGAQAAAKPSTSTQWGLEDLELEEQLDEDGGLNGTARLSAAGVILGTRPSFILLQRQGTGGQRAGHAAVAQAAAAAAWVIPPAPQTALASLGSYHLSEVPLRPDSKDHQRLPELKNSTRSKQKLTSVGKAEPLSWKTLLPICHNPAVTADSTLTPSTTFDAITNTGTSLREIATQVPFQPTGSRRGHTSPTPRVKLSSSNWRLAQSPVELAVPPVSPPVLQPLSLHDGSDDSMDDLLLHTKRHRLNARTACKQASHNTVRHNCGVQHIKQCSLGALQQQDRQQPQPQTQQQPPPPQRQPLPQQQQPLALPQQQPSPQQHFTNAPAPAALREHPAVPSQPSATPNINPWNGVKVKVEDNELAEGLSSKKAPASVSHQTSPSHKENCPPGLTHDPVQLHTTHPSSGSIAAIENQCLPATTSCLPPGTPGLVTADQTLPTDPRLVPARQAAAQEAPAQHTARVVTDDEDFGDMPLFSLRRTKESQKAEKLSTPTTSNSPNPTPTSRPILKPRTKIVLKPRTKFVIKCCTSGTQELDKGANAATTHGVATMTAGGVGAAGGLLKCSGHQPAELVQAVHDARIADAGHLAESFKEDAGASQAQIYEQQQQQCSSMWWTGTAQIYGGMDARQQRGPSSSHSQCEQQHKPQLAVQPGQQPGRQSQQLPVLTPRTCEAQQQQLPCPVLDVCQQQLQQWQQQQTKQVQILHVLDSCQPQWQQQLQQQQPLQRAAMEGFQSRWQQQAQQSSPGPAMVTVTDAHQPQWQHQRQQQQQQRLPCPALDACQPKWQQQLAHAQQHFPALVPDTCQLLQRQPRLLQQQPQPPQQQPQPPQQQPQPPQQQPQSPCLAVNFNQELPQQQDQQCRASKAPLSPADNLPGKPERSWKNLKKLEQPKQLPKAKKRATSTLSASCHGTPPAEQHSERQSSGSEFEKPCGKDGSRQGSTPPREGQGTNMKPPIASSSAGPQGQAKEPEQKRPARVVGASAEKAAATEVNLASATGRAVNKHKASDKARRQAGGTNVGKQRGRADQTAGIAGREDASQPVGTHGQGQVSRGTGKGKRKRAAAEWGGARKETRGSAVTTQGIAAQVQTCMDAWCQSAGDGHATVWPLKQPKSPKVPDADSGERLYLDGQVVLDASLSHVYQELQRLVAMQQTLALALVYEVSAAGHTQYCSSLQPLCKPQEKSLSKARRAASSTTPACGQQSGDSGKERSSGKGAVQQGRRTAGLMVMCFDANAHQLVCQSRTVSWAERLPALQCLPAFYLPLQTHEGPAWQLSLATSLSLVQELLQCKFLCCNAKELLVELKLLGLQVPPALSIQLKDPCVQCWLYEPHLMQGEDRELEAYCLLPLAVRYKLLQTGRELDGLDACLRTHAGLALTAQLTASVTDALHASTAKQAMEVEMQIPAVLAAMEAHGMGFNTTYLQFHRKRITQRLEAIKQRAHDLLGKDINLASPQQVAQVLYQDLQLPPPNIGTRGAAKTHDSTNEAALQALQQQHELPGLVLEFRCMQQVLSKWLDAPWVQDAMAAADNASGVARVRCSWHQTATATGRLSASNPNLQAVTKYTMSAQLVATSAVDSSAAQADDHYQINIRDAFMVPPGHMLISADYSQIELRVLAHMSGDFQLTRLLKKAGAEGDVFSLIASTWLRPTSTAAGVLVSPEEREKAKRVTYGIIYGLTEKGLGQQLKLDGPQAHALKESFLKCFQGVKAFIDSSLARARQQGFVTTLLGRRRGIKGLSATEAKAESLRKVVNSIVQGSAADLMKLAMLSWARQQEQWAAQPNCPQVNLVAQIHDELLLEVEDTPQCMNSSACALKDIMEKVMVLQVPLVANVTVGTKWGSLQTLERWQQSLLGL